MEILTQPSESVDCVSLVGNHGNAAIVVDDAQDFPVVQLAARLLAEDVQRVSGHRPAITNSPTGASHLIIAGTLGHSRLIEKLAAAGVLKDLDKITNRWEATLLQIVQRPFPGVDRALVMVGSDRRGTAYGLMRLSEAIGVSPWYWWADVSVQHQDVLAVKIPAPQVDSPGVKYRGIFINDEDWGLFPWAAKTFDPDFNNIGPKTYEKVFELMLRLRLNYLWPAMHPCSKEFGATPENAELADKYAIVAGSSHCEPMLCNNVHWNEQEMGRWNYSLNQERIHAYWENNVQARGAKEAVWTLGIRGIHDAGMQTPPKNLPDKISLMEKIFGDQRDLLQQHVTNEWGPVGQCFVPYKEVLPIYDAGLKVPADVTLVWVDDNFGYIRRLSAPEERKRAGGAGVYWHLSYYGGPHSYTWINTTAPALLWEELHKAWENDARSLWVINVGDIKPMEIGINYFSQLAWNPDGFPLGNQQQFLEDFARKNFGASLAADIADLLREFYRLGTIRKPELMERAWALNLSDERARQLENDYARLLEREKSLAGKMPPAFRDAYTEMVGFPARVLGMTGMIFMADRRAQLGADAKIVADEINQLRAALETQVKDFNTVIAGGKWNRMMPGLVTGKYLSKWNSQVRWPWGEPMTTNQTAKKPRISNDPPAGQKWRDAATADRQTPPGTGHWSVIKGLGPSSRAVALLPTGLSSAWDAGDTNAPALEFDFEAQSTNSTVFVDFLPTFRIYPGLKLRVAIGVDELPLTMVEIPCSSGAENENGTVRQSAVQDNYSRASLALPPLPPGKHTLRIRAVDPGAVIDRISLP